MTEHEDRGQRDAGIGKLIAAAGPGPRAGAEARERTYAAVHARWQDTVRRRQEAIRRRSRFLYGAFGLAASLLVAAAVLYWQQDTAPARDGSRPFSAEFLRIEGHAERLREGEVRELEASATAAGLAAGDSLRTGGDGRLALRLGRDLAVRVNVDSELILVDQNTVALLAGTLYIDSGNGTASPPLVVNTPLGAVAHVGTRYEVHFGNAGLRVRVREGAVKLDGPAGARIGQSGEQLDIGADGTASRTVIAPDDAVWNWATELASLPAADEYTVAETLAWVARERGLRLEYATGGAQQRWTEEALSGLPVDLSPSEMLEIIGQTTGLRYEIRSARLVVLN